MKLNSETWGYAPKNFAKWQRYIKENRCFKYSNKNYLSLNYLILISYTNLTKNNLIKINFYLFFLKKISLNKLF